MSLSSFNLGMDDAVCGAPFRASRYNDSDYSDGYSFAYRGDYEEYPFPIPMPPEPTIVDICGANGHPIGAGAISEECPCGERMVTG